MRVFNRPLVIAGREFRSRLLVGTGKFSSPEAMRDALAASGTEIDEQDAKDANDFFAAAWQVVWLGVEK